MNSEEQSKKKKKNRKLNFVVSKRSSDPFCFWKGDTTDDDKKKQMLHSPVRKKTAIRECGGLDNSGFFDPIDEWKRQRWWCPILANCSFLLLFSTVVNNTRFQSISHPHWSRWYFLNGHEHLVRENMQRRKKRIIIIIQISNEENEEVTDTGSIELLLQSLFFFFF